MKVYLLKITHIYIMFSDRIPFVNIEIVILFVKNQETITYFTTAKFNTNDNSSTVNPFEAMNVFVFVYSS